MYIEVLLLSVLVRLVSRRVCVFVLLFAEWLEKLSESLCVLQRLLQKMLHVARMNEVVSGQRERRIIRTKEGNVVL